MKLLIVLSIIANGYADKLDRAYLPPINAVSSGGSPGALTAPGVSPQSGISSAPGRQPVSGFGQSAQSNFGQGLPTSGRPGFSSGQPSSPFGGGSGSAQSGQGFGQGPSVTASSVLGSGSSSGSNFDFGASKGQISGSNFPAAVNTFDAGSQLNYRPQSSSPFSQELGKGAQGFNEPQAYKPERAQAAADRNAEILKYINENNGNTYTYSYETSNGISAEESGEATNGVKAQGGFSYTGDDGQTYSLTYTADENGFQPQGEHLPTPHPIPEEILKSIEENAKAAAAGTQEGAYNPEEYESEGSPQRYTGQSSLGRPQGQSQTATQGSFPIQSFATQDQSNEVSGNQGIFGTSPVSGSLNQVGQVRPNPQSNQLTSGLFKPQGQNGQQSQGLGINNQGPFDQILGQSSIGQGLGQISQGQGQGSSGYNYNQPQNTFGLGVTAQSRPQINTQGQTSPVSASLNGQDTFGLTGNRPLFFGNSQRPQTDSSQAQGFLNRPGDQLTGAGQRQQNQLSGNKQSLAPSQGSQIILGSQSSLGSTGSSAQGYQYQSNANRPSFGVDNRPSGSISQPSQGPQYKPNANQGISQFGIGNIGPNGQVGQNSQFQQNGNRPIGQTIDSNLGSTPYASGIQNTGSGSLLSQTNQPSFGSNVGPKGPSQFGPGSQTFASTPLGPSTPTGAGSFQAPYQYNKPSQSFPPQQQLLGSQGINGQRPGVGSPGSQLINGPRPGYSSPGSQSVSGQRPGVPGLQSGPRPGISSPGFQNINGQRPDISSTGYQGVNKQQPSISSQGSLTGQRPGTLPGTQGVNGPRPGLSTIGTQGVNGQRPDISSQEQFGGPRQPPSFNTQEGYKY